MIKLLKGFDIRVRIMSTEHKHHRFCGTVITVILMDIRTATIDMTYVENVPKSYWNFCKARIN